MDLDQYEWAVVDTVGENPPEIDVYELARKTREAGRPLHGGPTFRAKNEDIFNRLIHLGLIRVGKQMGTLALTDEGRQALVTR